MTSGNLEQPGFEDEEDPIIPDDDTPLPESEGPAASEEDFEPPDPDLEAIIDEE